MTFQHISEFTHPIIRRAAAKVAMRHRYCVIMRFCEFDDDQATTETVAVDDLNEALRMIADDDYCIAPDGYKAIWDGATGGFTRGDDLTDAVKSFVVSRDADKRQDRSTGA